LNACACIVSTFVFLAVSYSAIFKSVKVDSCVLAVSASAAVIPSGEIFPNILLLSALISPSNFIWSTKSVI